MKGERDRRELRRGQRIWAHLSHLVQDDLGGAQELAHVIVVLEHLELVPVKEPGGAL